MNTQRVNVSNSCVSNRNLSKLSHSAVYFRQPDPLLTSQCKYIGIIVSDFDLPIEPDKLGRGFIDFRNHPVITLLLWVASRELSLMSSCACDFWIAAAKLVCVQAKVSRKANNGRISQNLKEIWCRFSRLWRLSVTAVEPRDDDAWNFCKAPATIPRKNLKSYVRIFIEYVYLHSREEYYDGGKQTVSAQKSPANQSHLTNLSWFPSIFADWAPYLSMNEPKMPRDKGNEVSHV